MRNPKIQKLVGSLVTATIAGCMALSLMPELRCETGDCVLKSGSLCWDGDHLLRDYKLHMGFDG